MKTIFDEIEWNGLKLKNRMVRSATWEALADEEGHMEEAIYGIYEELAKGGVGLIISGFTFVSDHDHYFEVIARLSNDDLIPEHQRLTAAARRAGERFSLTSCGGSRRSSRVIMSR